MDTGEDEIDSSEYEDDLNNSEDESTELGDDNDFTEDDDEETEELIEEGDNDENNQCPICLNILSLGQDIGAPLTCVNTHHFCFDCLEEWSKNVNTCPVDRKEFKLIIVTKGVGGPVIDKIPITSQNLVLEDSTPDNLDDDVTYCEICGRCDREDRLLLCDNCDFGYHCECLDPPLETIPIQEWYCPDCNKTLFGSENDESGPNYLQEINRYNRRVGRRVIARTRASEVVRSRVARRRNESGGESPNEIVRNSSTKRKRKVRRRKKIRKSTKRSKIMKSSKRISSQTKRKRCRKSLRRSRKSRAASKPLVAPTPRSRITRKLGLEKDKSLGVHSLPTLRTVPCESLCNRRAAAGISQLSIFGSGLSYYGSVPVREELDETFFGSANETTSDALVATVNRRHVIDFTRERNDHKSGVVLNQQISSISSKQPNFDLLGDILANQTVLLTNARDVIITEEGTLKIKDSDPDKSIKKCAGETPISKNNSPPRSNDRSPKRNEQVSPGTFKASTSSSSRNSPLNCAISDDNDFLISKPTPLFSQNMMELKRENDFGNKEKKKFENELSDEEKRSRLEESMEGVDIYSDIESIGDTEETSGVNFKLESDDSSEKDLVIDDTHVKTSNNEKGLKQDLQQPSETFAVPESTSYTLKPLQVPLVTESFFKDSIDVDVDFEKKIEHLKHDFKGKSYRSESLCESDRLKNIERVESASKVRNDEVSNSDKEKEEKSMVNKILNNETIKINEASQSYKGDQNNRVDKSSHKIFKENEAKITRNRDIGSLSDLQRANIQIENGYFESRGGYKRSLCSNIDEKIECMKSEFKVKEFSERMENVSNRKIGEIEEGEIAENDMKIEDSKFSGKPKRCKHGKLIVSKKDRSKHSKRSHSKERTDRSNRGNRNDKKERTDKIDRNEKIERNEKNKQERSDKGDKGTRSDKNDSAKIDHNDNHKREIPEMQERRVESLGDGRGVAVWKKVSQSSKMRSYRDGKPKDEQILYRESKVLKKEKKRHEEKPSSRYDKNYDKTSASRKRRHRSRSPSEEKVDHHKISRTDRHRRNQCDDDKYLRHRKSHHGTSPRRESLEDTEIYERKDKSSRRKPDNSESERDIEIKIKKRKHKYHKHRHHRGDSSDDNHNSEIVKRQESEKSKSSGHHHRHKSKRLHYQEKDMGINECEDSRSNGSKYPHSPCASLSLEPCLPVRSVLSPSLEEFEDASERAKKKNDTNKNILSNAESKEVYTKGNKIIVNVNFSKWKALEDNKVEQDDEDEELKQKQEVQQEEQNQEQEQEIDEIEEVEEIEEEDEETEEKENEEEEEMDENEEHKEDLKKEDKSSSDSKFVINKPGSPPKKDVRLMSKSVTEFDICWDDSSPVIKTETAHSESSNDSKKGMQKTLLDPIGRMATCSPESKCCPMAGPKTPPEEESAKSVMLSSPDQTMPTPTQDESLDDSNSHIKNSLKSLNSVLTDSRDGKTDIYDPEAPLESPEDVTIRHGNNDKLETTRTQVVSPQPHFNVSDSGLSSNQFKFKHSTFKNYSFGSNCLQSDPPSSSLLAQIQQTLNLQNKSNPQQQQQLQQLIQTASSSKGNSNTTNIPFTTTFNPKNQNNDVVDMEIDSPDSPLAVPSAANVETSNKESSGTANNFGSLASLTPALKALLDQLISDPQTTYQLIKAVQQQQLMKNKNANKIFPNMTNGNFKKPSTIAGCNAPKYPSLKKLPHHSSKIKPITEKVTPKKAIVTAPCSWLIGSKLTDNDDLPSSAVELQVKEKYIKKLNRQERVVEEVKLVLKPHYQKREITKDEYKDILRKSVPKICHSRTGEINPSKIRHLVESYIQRFKHFRKKK